MEDGRSFTVWPSYWEALHELNDGQRLKLYDAIFAFGTLGVEPFFEDVVCKAVFAVIRPNIEKSVKAHENGSIGGRSKAPSKAPSTIPDEGLSTEREREGEGGGGADNGDW